jgi:hypothetical protein
MKQSLSPAAMPVPQETGIAASPPDDTSTIDRAVVRVPDRPGLTWRSLLLGLLVIPANAAILLMGEVAWNVVRASPLSLLYSAVTTLFLIGLGNLCVAKRFPRFALSRSELAIIYVMASMGTVMCGEDLVQLMMLHIPFPFSSAAANTSWAHQVLGYLPHWLVPTDPQALHGFYAGDFRLWNLAAVVRAWLVPLLAWLGVVLALAGLTLSFSVLARRAWTDHERLTFPVAQLPIEMISPSGLYAQRLFWVGFALTAALDTIQGLHTLMPVLPQINTRIGYYVNPTAPPWDVFHLAVFLYPFAVGLTYFVPLDLAFTLWLVALGWPFLAVARESMGLNPPTGNFYTLVGFQTAGVWLMIALLSVWKLLPFLRTAWEQACGRGDPEPAHGEPMSYRWAFGVLFVSALAVVGFLWLAGMTLWIAVAWLLLYFLIAAALIRMRAELGPPGHDFHNTGPEQLIVATVGSLSIRPRDLTLLTLFFWLTRKEGARFSPQFLEGFRIGRAFKTRLNQVMWAQLLALVVGMVSAYVIYVYLAYKGQIPTAQYAGMTWEALPGWLEQPRPPNLAALREVAIGAGVTLALTLLRLRFLGFPLHPVGLAVGTTFMMQYLWFSVLTGWLLKGLILRYGGRRLYQRGIPLFAGLIVGDFAAGTGWVAIGILLHQQVWGFYPF